MEKKKNSLWLPLIVLIVCVALAVAAVWFAYPAYKARNTKLVIWQAPTNMRSATKEDMLTGSEIKRPMDLVLSSAVRVTANGRDVPVFETNVCLGHNDSSELPTQSRTPVVNFDFWGKVNMQIDMGDFTVETVELLPSACGIVPVIQGSKVNFTLDKPGNYSLVFNGSDKRAMHIFTSKPTDEDEQYAKGGENILYYGPGEYMADAIDVKDGQTLYVSGGAVIHGNIRTDHAQNVKILGRGIIDGSLYGGNARDRNVRIPINLSCSSNIVVKGLVLLNPNGWVVQGYRSQNADISDVRIVSSRANGDGVTLQSCSDFKVSDVFVRSWDDSLVVKNYEESSHDITFDSCQIWTDLAQSMEIGYETNKGDLKDISIKDITFRNITVLYNMHKPIMSIHNGDECLVSGVLYKNIVVEHADMTATNALFEFNIIESSWNVTKNRGQTENIFIDTVTVHQSKYNRMKAIISGYGESNFVKNVTFQNVNIFGKKVENKLGPLEFEIGKNVTGLYIQ